MHKQKDPSNAEVFATHPILMNRFSHFKGPFRTYDLAMRDRSFTLRHHKQKDPRQTAKDSSHPSDSDESVPSL